MFTNIIISFALSLFISGCVYNQAPISVSSVEKLITIETSMPENKKWIATAEYQITAKARNSLETDLTGKTFFMQYRGMLDDNNKIIATRLYLSNVISIFPQGFNKIVGEDNRYYTFKTYLECALNKDDKVIIDKNLVVGKNTTRKKNCEIDTLVDINRNLKNTINFENNKTLIHIDKEQLVKLARTNYKMNLFMEDGSEYILTIPQQVSEGFYRSYFKF